MGRESSWLGVFPLMLLLLETALLTGTLRGALPQLQEEPHHTAESGTHLSKTPSDKETVCICIRVRTHTASEREVNVEVQFNLPKVYPIVQPPGITLSSQHISIESLRDITDRVASHCKALLPDPCIFDVVEEIKAELLKLEPVELAQEPVEKLEKLKST